MKPQEDDASAQTNRISIAENVLILVATALIAVAVLQAQPLQSANDRSRWATVWSLVERRTFQIDEIDAVARFSTIDKVRYRANESEPWHFYSSKPPLLSTLVAVVYAVERATLGYGLFNDTALVTRMLLFVVNVVPFFFVLRSLCRCLQRFGASDAARLFILAVAGFGSILNPYLTTLNNHTPAVACAMFSITAMARLIGRKHLQSAVEPTATSRSIDFALLGFFSALTCCFELPAAQMGVLAFAAALWIDRRKTFCWFVPFAAIPLIAFFATNWLATGGVKPFYATYGTETYVYVHNGIPSYWSSPRDLDANSEPPHVYLFHCVLGHHGILSLTPVLCISLAGWLLGAFRKDQSGLRLLILSGALMTLVTLGFYLTRTDNYNYGGNSVGLRWMLWLSPFWWIAMLPALDRAQRSGPRFVAAILLLVSILSVGWSMSRPWKPSWLFEQMESAGWIRYRTPQVPFEPPRPTVIGKIPSERDSRMTLISSDGQRLTLSITSEGNGTTLTIAATLTNSATPDEVVSSSAVVRRDRFAQGRPIEEWWMDAVSEIRGDSPSGVQVKMIDLPALFRGLPESRNFVSAGSTWIPSKADPTKAWKVDRGAARVIADDPVFGNCWHRCDVLFCDQLPFGVLQWKTAVTSDATGETLSTQTWIAEQH